LAGADPVVTDAGRALRTRGLLTGAEPVLTDAGRVLRSEVEAVTDRLAEPAYAVLGEEGRVRLAELTRPLSRTVVKAGMLDPATIVKPRP
jgi:helix-turn-helix protein